MLSYKGTHTYEAIAEARGSEEFVESWMPAAHLKPVIVNPLVDDNASLVPVAVVDPNEKKRRAGGRFSLPIEQQKQQYEQKNFDVADDTDSCEKENDSSTLGRGSCIPRDRTTTTRRDFFWRQNDNKRERKRELSGGRV